ncbi:MAG TPA: RelA/SpoT family protein [Candidatus Absconditabacterales bacterium]|nr:RelA/SpoT family protein [Candidatus Absconditabacterales bacterium]HOQ78896.1 RelA/SpoT family protein [Candidatus Absconditabacterales bacterium]HPK27787.1 RelA/SpoT family protein [Candidatus Absconditabacterales bacterium]
MDINQLDSFLDYQIDSTENLDILVQEIITKAQKYLPENSKEGILKAYHLAKKAHEGQSRLSGEPYIVHPLKSTIILMQLKPDLESIQTCILHDVIEDTMITQEEIQKEFGSEVAQLCQGLVKVSKVRYKGEDRDLETIKKTFLAMGKDLRVIFVKLADRIHNLQTLHYHPEANKREKIALETMKIYVPIAKRLGLYQYQVALENACFKILYPEEFERIIGHLKKGYSGSDKYIKKGIFNITKLLLKEGISEFDVKGRTKSPYRIREKMEYRYQTTDISSVMDLLAFRIIAKDISDCYVILGIIHKHYTPLIKKIKDYIAVPKFNGYRSIHTTILGMFKFPIEIQIRTKDMDDVAEYGVAAHYAYSESKGPSRVSQKQAEWVRKLQELVNAYTESDEKDQFKNKLDIELLSKETLLYTPKGDIIELPKGSTVLDFAFYIHTEIGLKFKNAIVNGEIVPITHIPNTGDIVKINTFRYQYTANKHRSSILKTPSAKTKLLKFIKNTQQEEILDKSIKILNSKLKELGLPNLVAKNSKINQVFEKKDLEKKLIDATENRLLYNEIIKKAYPKEYKEFYQNKSSKTPPKTENISIKNIIIDDDKLINYYLCPECRPIFPQKIIAKTGKDGIKVHNLNCRALKTISPNKLLEAHRNEENKNIYTVISTLKMDKNLDFIKLLEIFTKLQIEVNSFSIKDDKDDKTKIINLTRTLKTPGQIGMVREQIKKYGHKLSLIKREII